MRMREKRIMNADVNEEGRHDKKKEKRKKENLGIHEEIRE